MGLDVYLNHSSDREEALKRQKEAEDYADMVWRTAGDYNSLTEDEKQEIEDRIKEFNERLNLDHWGESNDIERIEDPSKIHPDHMFRVGYLRSSYNSGGINSVLTRIGCPDLYDIFQPEDHEYNVTVDWPAAQTRAQEAIDALKAHMASNMADYDVIEVYGFNAAASKEEALKILKAELEHKSPLPGGYSNKAGDWFLDGLTVVGAVPGTPTVLGTPRFFLFTKNANEDSSLKWYLEALEVTKEMTDYVLAQPDPENYWLSWSA